MEVLVKRGTGDRVAPQPIIDGLCVNVNVCREKGRNFLDENGKSKIISTIETPLYSLSLGDIVALYDPELGTKKFAKIRSIIVDAAFDNALEIKTTLILERDI